jgi:ABC-type multidrug transport system fused ATPase/permease subunit
MRSRILLPGRRKEQIQCPEGNFCRQGAFEPAKCTAGSNCPAGSVRDMSFLPLAVLLIVDALLITATIISKIQDRFKSHHKTEKRNGSKKAYLAMGAGRFNSKSYQQLDDDHKPYNGSSDNSIHMESRIGSVIPRQPTGFEELGAMEANFRMATHSTTMTETGRIDLRLFVQSLLKCLGATKFGLSFEFRDLSFQPKKNSKPILSQVSGLIDAGSHWGVMGASGAEKCEFCFHSEKCSGTD